MITLHVRLASISWDCELNDAEATIGRASGNSVQINEKRISRKHARIERVGRSLRIVDCGSGNGTWVNGIRITSARLRAWDEIRLGGAGLTVLSSK